MAPPMEHNGDDDDDDGDGGGQPPLSSPGWVADISEPNSGPVSSSPPPTTSSPPLTPSRRAWQGKAGSSSFVRGTLRQVTPGSFASPRTSKMYPIPASTANMLEARRLAFFHQRQPLAAPNSAHPADARRLLQPGPATSRADQLSAFKRPPSALISKRQGEAEDADVAARLNRQRFRARCQAVLARERGRQKALSKARGVEVLSDTTSDVWNTSALHTDNLSSSDATEREDNDWQYQDEELVRRIMLAEYRRLLHAQEASGQREVGLLGADEVAWLEEELRQDHGPGIPEGEMQPPPDVLNEEAWLYEQYINAFASGNLSMAGENEDNFDVIDTASDTWDDETLQRIEQEAKHLVGGPAAPLSETAGFDDAAMDTS